MFATLQFSNMAPKLVAGVVCSPKGLIVARLSLIWGTHLCHPSMFISFTSETLSELLHSTEHEGLQWHSEPFLVFYIIQIMRVSNSALLQYLNIELFPSR